MGKAVTQCLNVFAYLPQDPTYVSSIFIWQLETSKFLLIQGLWWLLFICVVTGTHVVLPTCRHTQIKINKWLNIKYIYDNIWYHYHHLLQLLNEICETHFPFKFCCILSHNNGNNKKIHESLPFSIEKSIVKISTQEINFLWHYLNIIYLNLLNTGPMNIIRQFWQL